MSSTMNAKPTIAPQNQKMNKEKKEHRLVVAPPTLRPGGVMPPPQSKNGQDGTGVGTEEFTFNSLVSSISSLSPWAEVRSRPIRPRASADRDARTACFFRSGWRQGLPSAPSMRAECICSRCARVSLLQPPPAAEDGEGEVGQVVRPEDALEFFQKQTMNMDKEALLARVAEAAAREADAVTKLGQLT